MNVKGGKKVPKKKTNGYEMAEPIQKGEILTDIKKKQWIIGNSIGVGGFGEIYEAALYSGKAPKTYPAVIKIEPHGNGPLFVEMHFYMRNANPDEIDSWRKKKGLSSLGMPKFLGSGSHEYNKTKYRFLVVERYSTDLWKIFNENGRRFPEHTVYNIALQVIDVLEYIHNKTYIHGDIKGGNLLMDLKSPKIIYLVDFGLACHYTTKAAYTPDPKKAHDGTPEYTSRDAHKGVPTMRGDIEILGYNMIQWLCGTLPWEHDMKDPTKVQKQKEDAFTNLNAFLNKCFNDDVPDAIIQYMKLLDKIKYNEAPNYTKFKDILIQGLNRLKKMPYDKLEFKSDVKVENISVSTKPKLLKNIATTKTTATVTTNEMDKELRIDVVRLKKQNEMEKKAISLDESVSTVLDAKFETGTAAINHLLDSVDFDSESEYDIQITKRRKKSKKEEASSPEKKIITRKKKEFVSKEESSGSLKQNREKTDATAPVRVTPKRAAKK